MIITTNLTCNDTIFQNIFQNLFLMLLGHFLLAPLEYSNPVMLYSHIYFELLKQIRPCSMRVLSIT